MLCSATDEGMINKNNSREDTSQKEWSKADKAKVLLHTKQTPEDDVFCDASFVSEFNDPQ